MKLTTMTRMTTKKSTKAFALAAAATLVALALGCDANKKDNGINALFVGNGEDRVSRFSDAQAANGARADAMLYPHHFTAGQLNSLGRSKVLLMIEDADSTESVVVHLVNAGEGDLLAQRKASVELYLRTAEGPNKLAFHPAAPNLVRFAKTESGKLDDAGLPQQPQGATPPPPAATIK